jgi:hypothetical protein
MVSSTFPLSKVAHPRLIGLQTRSCHAFQPISGQIQLTLARWRWRCLELLSVSEGVLAMCYLWVLMLKYLSLLLKHQTSTESFSHKKGVPAGPAFCTHALMTLL